MTDLPARERPLLSFLRDVTSQVMFERFVSESRVLYHYTTAEGLLGILAEQTIWATNFRYLNDSTEFLYGLSIVRALAARNKARRVGDRRGPWLELLDAMCDAVAANSNLYTACFSELRDDLSQWRAYGGRAEDRFCLGFNAGSLRLECESVACTHTRLAHVCYDAVAQEALVSRELEKVSDELGDKGSSLAT
jgi:hypothetical protein